MYVYKRSTSHGPTVPLIFCLCQGWKSRMLSFTCVPYYVTTYQIERVFPVNPFCRTLIQVSKIIRDISPKFRKILFNFNFIILLDFYLIKNITFHSDSFSYHSFFTETLPPFLQIPSETTRLGRY